MRGAVLGLVMGSWLLQRQPQLPAWGEIAALFVVAAVLAGLWKIRRAALFRLGITVLLGAAVGYGWAAVLAHHRLSDSLPSQWEGRDVAVTGVIAGLPQPLERGVRFLFDIEASGEARLPRRVQLSWYNGLAPEEFQDIAPVRAGERWRFTVRLRRPRGLANPHGFDYEAWLLERGIRATGYVRPGVEARRVDTLAMRPGYLLERLRERVRERFWDALPSGRHTGVLIALAIGEQSAIAAPQWQVFARTGVSHLMSISGLHVTMVSGLFAWLVFALWCRVPRLALRLPAQKAAALAGFAAAFSYCLISGFAVPAQRTLYMIGAVALALVLQRAGSPSRVLSAALGLVLILDPWAVLAPGFWLSFGAVALIFYVGVARPEPRRLLAQWGVVQWAVTLGLAPLLLILFQQVSIVSPLANAVAIPLVSFAVTPLALLGGFLPFDMPLLLGHTLLEWLMPFLDWLATLETAVWQQHAPAPWTLPLALAGILWLLAPRGVPSRSVGLVLLIPMFAQAPARPAAGELWLTFLDVGQGTAVVARTRGHAMLYDAGPAWSLEADAGSRVVVPYLRAEGIGRLDALVISQEDADHSGGARTVLESIPVGQLITSLPRDHPVQALAPYRLPCQAGRAWEWDSVRFTVLHPSQAHYANPWTSINERSCVLRIEALGASALLAGDIGSKTELELLARHGAALKADVLLVPHHGSGSSSSSAFVEAVAPAHAVFSLGYGNRYRHPHPQVVARYAAAGSAIERSDQRGAITVRFARGVSVQSHRDEARRYWHARAL
ncbi:MAG: DNA internalization-related competence protein ComEC/Rec2 [Betaproteobacteria bacterium RIFCSPLOWO2_02_FULL_65_24]|nr:MAG: DNA internalization-related competence protein ComEC/Rec2 [Betaproteobacteria bacterium RIFCSPLOWO2_02_FULL_65_24]OGA71904.1 MAG: DNA internalization-related competence protein ComEC/Rec2 [Betaproteobacteria bacterium RIFCSPLOWO2_12_FULL_66_14]